MPWFESLTGIIEKDAQTVRAQLRLEGDRLFSLANGQSWVWGRLETPSLAELRKAVAACSPTQGRLSVTEVQASAQHLHADPTNAGAVFQVASQFNLLEMTAPHITPEDGLERYHYDPTQGPACAMAAGAGTIYRHYFVPIKDQIGQTRTAQLDMLADLGTALGNDSHRLWTMENGYAMASRQGLAHIHQTLEAASEAQWDRLRGLLRIGVQWNTQVTLNAATHTVTQAYCSALPVAYSTEAPAQWTLFARLVLEAAYEATLCVARLNPERQHRRQVFLTFLGGGAFGNAPQWIHEALIRALEKHRDADLAVTLVCRRPTREAKQIAALFA